MLVSPVGQVRMARMMGPCRFDLGWVARDGDVVRVAITHVVNTERIGPRLVAVEHHLVLRVARERDPISGLTGVLVGLGDVSTVGDEHRDALGHERLDVLVVGLGCACGGTVRVHAQHEPAGVHAALARTRKVTAHSACDWSGARQRSGELTDGLSAHGGDPGRDGLSA